MKLSSPTSLLLNLGHAMDHWVIAIFLYTVSVIAGVWGADWKELTPYAFGASFMFGAGSIVSGKLGDQWGRRNMMFVFFLGMGLSCMLIALCQNKWQIGASLSVLLATRFGWQMAYIVPGVVSLAAAVLFHFFVPNEKEAPSKRKAKSLDLPPNVMARVFFIMTCAAVSGSIVFNFTTNGNGEMLKSRIAELAANPWMLSVALLVIFSVASLMQLVVGALIDRYPLKNIYLPILVAQIPLFLLASQVNGWALLVVTTLFMVFVFGAIPFTDAMIVKYIDDRMRSRVTGMRLAIGFGVSSLVTAGIGPSVKEAGFPVLLMLLAGVACITTLAISFLPSERQTALAALKPAE
jgi:MFS family permease